jgi:type IV pilus assembly protein PilA
VYQSGGSGPGANSWGCEGAVASKYVAGIETDNNGVVMATIRGISSLVDTNTVTLAPLANSNTVANSGTGGNMGSGLFGWRCGATADGTTVNLKYLPGSCRGAN